MKGLGIGFMDVLLAVAVILELTAVALGQAAIKLLGRIGGQYIAILRYAGYAIIDYVRNFDFNLDDEHALHLRGVQYHRSPIGPRPTTAKLRRQTFNYP